MTPKRCPAVTAVTILFFSFGCGSSKTSFVPSDTDAEWVAALVAGASGSGSLAMINAQPRSMVATLFDFLSPFSAAHASNSCPTFSTSSCSSGSESLTYNSCASTGGNSATWTGSQALTFGSNSQCLAGVPVCGSGNTLTRTFGSGTTEIVSSFSGENTSNDTVNLDSCYHRTG